MEKQKIYWYLKTDDKGKLPDEICDQAACLDILSPFWLKSVCLCAPSAWVWSISVLPTRLVLTLRVSEFLLFCHLLLFFYWIPQGHRSHSSLRPGNTLNGTTGGILVAILLSLWLMSTSPLHSISRRYATQILLGKTLDLCILICCKLLVFPVRTEDRNWFSRFRKQMLLIVSKFTIEVLLFCQPSHGNNKQVNVGHGRYTPPHVTGFWFNSETFHELSQRWES